MDAIKQVIEYARSTTRTGSCLATEALTELTKLEGEVARLEVQNADYCEEIEKMKEVLNKLALFQANQILKSIIDRRHHDKQ